MPRSVLSMVSIPIIAAPERPKCMRHNIHGPWIVDGVDFHSCLILNYMNITSTLSHLTIDSCRFLESLSSRNYLPVLLVSIFLLNSSQPCGKKQLVIVLSTSNIIYWDEQRWMFYSSSCLLMDSLAQEGRSSIILPNICFSIPICLWMAEPDGFHCPGIYTFI